MNAFRLPSISQTVDIISLVTGSRRQHPGELVFSRKMIDQTEQLSRLICEIYDAAIDVSRWSAVLGEAARFVGGSSAALFSKDAVSGAGNVYYEYGTDPYYRQLYFEKYVKLDPATTGHFFAEVEQPISVTDLMPYHEFLETRFYREWVQPQGIVDFVAAVLDKSATSVAMFGVFRHERDGLVDDDTRRRVRLVVPHIRRAVLVGRLIDLKTTEAATFADALDGLSVGVCFVDADGRVVHANGAGRAILDAGDLLSNVGGRVVARDGKIDKALREVFAAAGAGDAAIGTQGIALPLRAQDGTRYVAHVLPLTSGTRRLAGMAYSAVAALFIRKSAIEVPSSPEVIARAYKLTPTELRVLLAIVEVGGVPEVAAALGVAESTIKTHLGRLFEKTSATRQADLVKIVAGFATPFAGQDQK
jgi:DNA-binding CsgD family transcriptional regulator/PAS domain-containing protein